MAKRHNGPGGMTRREFEIASCVAYEGLSNAGIGQRLFVSPDTVRTHLTNIYVKLGVRNRAQLCLWMAEHRAAQSDVEATPTPAPDDVALVQAMVAEWMDRLSPEERPGAVLDLMEHLTQSRPLLHAVER